MIAAVTMYRVVCDEPDCTSSPQDGGGTWAWAHTDTCVDEARDADWAITSDGQHYCPDHAPTDAEDD